MKDNTYSAVILAGGNGTYLYPLTPKYPKSLLPIGNKKMIYYQIQFIEQAEIKKTYILINNETKSVEFDLKNNYKGKMELEYIYTPDKLQTYNVLNKFLNDRDIQENLIIVSGDTITNLHLKDLIAFHESNKSTFTFALKQEQKKKQDKKQEKKQQQDEKLFLVDSDNKVVYSEALSQAQILGISINTGILRNVSEAKFHKVLDSHIYIIDQQVLKIIKTFTDEGISNWASQFIPLLVNNQTNTNLLKYSVSENIIPTVPIKPFAFFLSSEHFMKRVITIKDYEQINMKSLIVGDKQIPLFVPTIYTDALQQTKSEMVFVTSSAQIKQGCKIRRSCILGGVKIGKGVDIVNSIILKNAVIDDNCKLYNCIVGSKSHIRKGCVLRECQVANDTQVRQGSNVTQDVILNQQ